MRILILLSISLFILSCVSVDPKEAMQDSEYFVKEYIADSVDADTFFPDVPIARKLKLYYVKVYERNGEIEQIYSYNDGEYLKGRSANIPIPPQMLPNTGGVSEEFSIQAKQAADRGDHELAQMLSQASLVSEQVQLTGERMQAGAAAFSASVAMLANLLEHYSFTGFKGSVGSVKLHLNRLDKTINDKAPAGSVLHAYFYEYDKYADAPPPLANTVTQHLILYLEPGNNKLKSVRVLDNQKWFERKKTQTGAYTPPEGYKRFVLPATMKEGYKNWYKLDSNKENYFTERMIVSAIKDLYSSVNEGPMMSVKMQQAKRKAESEKNWKQTMENIKTCRSYGMDLNKYKKEIASNTYADCKFAAFSAAIGTDSKNVYSYMLETGYDVNTISQTKISHLHGLVLSLNHDAIKRFLNMSPNPLLKNDQGKTALQFAKELQSIVLKDKKPNQEKVNLYEKIVTTLENYEKAYVN